MWVRLSLCSARSDWLSSTAAPSSAKSIKTRTHTTHLNLTSHNQKQKENEKICIGSLLGLGALATNAQMNYKVQTACHPQDVKHYDTERLRSAFMMDKVMAPDEINLTYTLYDRLIYGGVMPVNKVLKLEKFHELGPEITYFLERRELGVINVGGDGVVTVDGKAYEMKYKEALYVVAAIKKLLSRATIPPNPPNSTSTRLPHISNSSPS